MAATIWKFPLPIGDVVDVPMPEGARVLTVAAISDAPFLWAIVDPYAPVVDREFVIRGTGHPLGDVGAYLGTFIVLGGTLVFHVFEARP
jgi:hypothetical protein